MLILAEGAQDLGQAGERLAADHLLSRGYRILARRYRTRYGEVDLIASSRGTLVFVEVKTRRSGLYGPPGESVGPRKRVRLARAAAHYLASAEPPEATTRFDVIAIDWRDSGPVLEHIEDAFRLD